ncbi:MAG: hypothetical protein PHC51_08295 [bacterium]|nr:hypothetical protein [bacterium]
MNRLNRILVGTLVMLASVFLSSAYANYHLEQSIEASCFDIKDDSLSSLIPLVKFYRTKQVCEEFYPEELSQAFLRIFVGTLIGSIACIGVGLTRRREQKNNEVFGSAAWVKVNEIKNLGLLGKGVFLGKLVDGRFLRHDGPEHCAVIAPTRTGNNYSHR